MGKKSQIQIALGGIFYKILPDLCLGAAFYSDSKIKIFYAL